MSTFRMLLISSTNFSPWKPCFFMTRATVFFSRPGFVCGQILGADDDDGQVTGLGVGAQTVDHAEAVEARHDEVQQKDVGTIGLNGLKAGHAIERGIQREFRFRQDLAQHIRDVGIVIHHENVFLPAKRGTGDAVERIPDRDGIERLEQVSRRAQSEAEGFIIDDGEQDDRDVGSGRICFQIVKDLPAIHAGHEDIQQDGLRLLFAGQAQAILSIACAGDFEFLLVEVLLQKVDCIGIIVDDQDAFFGRTRLGLRRGLLNGSRLMSLMPLMWTHPAAAEIWRGIEPEW